MENKILKTLDFDLSNPTVMTFLRQECAKSVCWLFCFWKCHLCKEYWEYNRL